MKKVLHVSTECFPAAKSGGLGDVVGALPIYQPQVDVKASVVIPYYDLPWFAQQKFKCKYKGVLRIDGDNINFEVLRLTSKVLEYPLYAVSLPGLFDRPSIYLADHGEGFGDEPKRNIGFQRAVVQWLTNKKQKFDIIHCHDHQSGLIPFFLKFVGEFERIRNIPTILTIHNAQYRGQFDWTDQYLLPEYDRNFNGWLDWDNCIHSLAAAVKLADRVTTVSPSYMDEITHSSGSLEYLFKSEATKCSGILNGIDTKAWDTRTDKFLDIPRKRQWAPFKSKNKELLCDKYGLNPEFPLVSFIGRLAYEKGADLLADAVSRVCHTNQKVSFILLGSGDRQMEQNLMDLKTNFKGQIETLIMYNEGVAHELYAGSDFLMMPSRFEPCGLNQMYAMRYGTIPIVRSTGGLKDTVPDYTNNGNGIAYTYSDADSLYHAVLKALNLFEDSEGFKKLRKKIVGLDFSWEQSVKLYADLYDQIT